MRKIPEDARTEPGWALARVGDGGWWPAIQRGLRAGRFDDEIVVALADILRKRGHAGRLGDERPVRAARATSAPAWPSVSPRSSASSSLALIARTEDRPPQREMANAVQQAANVRGAFEITAPPPPGTGVLLDDQRISGWTLAMVGGQLRRAGAQAVVPVVLATPVVIPSETQRRRPRLRSL